MRRGSRVGRPGRCSCTTTASFPSCGAPESRATQAKRWLYEHVAFRAFDGSLVISTYLRDYCVRHLRAEARALLVPILVDVSEFAPDGDEGSEIGDRIAYCGYLNQPEVRSVIESFAALAPDFPELELLLIGGARRPEAVPAVWELAGRLGVADRVRTTGKVKREDMPALLRSARVLVLPRPAGAFSAAGLPTKVGEYLATGRPVLMTANGDISLYLKDGVDAYLVAPDDLRSFTERLRYVLEHPSEATRVGACGREAARQQFDPAVHGRRILEYKPSCRRRRLALAPWHRGNDRRGNRGAETDRSCHESK